MLRYGLRNDTERDLVFIDDAERGLKCGCVCPCCGHDLIAKNRGAKKEHHFAHASGAECAGACYLASIAPINSANSPRRKMTISNSDLDIITILVVGASAFEIASVPLLVVGYHRMHSSADVYNVACATAQTKPYWTIQASDNGLGLALKF